MGHEFVHEADESVAVMSFKKINHLVDIHVFEAMNCLPSQASVKANGASEGSQLSRFVFICRT